MADYRRLADQVLAPPEAAGFWDWCAAHLRTYHGHKWSAERASLHRHWYDLLEARLSGRVNPHDPYAHRCEQLWLVFAAQIAKSTLLYALLLYVIQNHPRRVGFYMGRLKDLHATRTTRLERMLLTMPQLERLLPRGDEARDRALGAQHWTVGTSTIFWQCGAVADDWRSQDFPLILADEFDTYPENCDEEGDPIALGLVRQRTFGRTRLIAGASTPGTVSGHAWRRLCTGSHERPLIACPSCGGADYLNPRQLCLAGGRKFADVHPDEILRERLGRWTCRHCGTMHASAAVRAMVRQAETGRPWCPGTWAISPDHPQGIWKPHADLDAAGVLQRIHPAEGTIRTGQAGALYSRDETADTQAAKRAIAEQGRRTQLQTHTNTEDAEPWIIVASREEVDTDRIREQAQPRDTYRLGAIPETAPPGGWLMLILDQQGNLRSEWWFPWVLRYIVPGGESWLVDAGKARSEAERDMVETRTWTIHGRPRQPDLLAIDVANGHFQFDGYLWASADTQRRVCFRGDPRLPDGTPWQEVFDSPRRRRTPRPAGVREFRLAPHYWRDRLWDRMRRRQSEPAWWLPTEPPDYYLRSLTSEEQIVEPRRVPGVGWRDQLVWKPRVISSTADRETYRDDNHWWDAEAACAALTNALGLDRPATADEPVTATDYVAQITGSRT